MNLRRPPLNLRRPGQAARAALSAVPEAGLWTGLWAASPAWIHLFGPGAVRLAVGPSWVVAATCLGAAAAGGLVLPAQDRAERGSRRAAWFAAGAVVVGLVVLAFFGPLAAVACLFAAWRGVSAAGYGRSAHELRRAVGWTIIGYAAAGLLAARAGLSLTTLLTGLFLAVLAWLAGTVLQTGATVDVGARTYSIPYRPWQYRVAMVATAAAIGLPALLILTWAAWKGPAGLGLGTFGSGVRAVLLWIWGIFAELIMLVLTVVMMAIVPLINWLRNLIAAYRGKEPPEQIVNPGPPEEWLKQAKLKQWSVHVPPILVALLVVALVAFLIYRYLKSAGAEGQQALADKVEDLAPTPVDPGKRSGRLFGRKRTGGEGLSPVRVVYRAFLARMARLGQPRPAWTTPDEYARRVEGVTMAEELTRLTTIYDRARYGRPEDLGEAGEREALRMWEQLRTGLSAARSRPPGRRPAP